MCNRAKTTNDDQPAEQGPPVPTRLAFGQGPEAQQHHRRPREREHDPVREQEQAQVDHRQRHERADQHEVRRQHPVGAEAGGGGPEQGGGEDGDEPARAGAQAGAGLGERPRQHGDLLRHPVDHHGEQRPDDQPDEGAHDDERGAHPPSAAGGGGHHVERRGLAGPDRERERGLVHEHAQPVGRRDAALERGRRATASPTGGTRCRTGTGRGAAGRDRTVAAHPACRAASR